MGLDTTHDCWHGPYSAFNRWRTTIAATVGIKLDEMVGFGGDRPWPSRTAEPLVILLDHSDCEDDIAWQDCAPLADRLAAILPDLPTADYWAPDLTTAGRARQFIAGLRDAAAAQENVEFH